MMIKSRLICYNCAMHLIRNFYTNIINIFIGGVSQAINDLAYAVEEKRYRVREKTLAGDNYGYIDVQPSSNYASQLPQCQCGNMQYQIQQTRQRMSNGPCCAHEMQRSHAMMSNMNYSTPSYNHHRHQSGIGNESSGYLPHSRSLEHYNYSDPTNMQQHTMLTHRHSFDHQQQGCTAAHHQHSGHGHQQQRLHNSMQHQQQCYRNPAQHFYEPSYDCIDNNSMGGSSISYAAVAAGGSGASYNINGSAYSNSYNVSGNRIPLPHYISNQLSEYDKTSHTGGMESAYNSDNHMYAQVTKTPQNYIANSSAAMMGGVAGYGVIHTQNKFDPGTLENSTSSSTKDPAQRSHSYLTEHLIDFGDPIIPPPPAEQFDPYHQQYQHHEDVKVKRNNKISENDINMPPGNYNQIRDQSFGNNASDMYVYAKPIPKESRQMHKALHNSMDKSTYVRKNVSYTPAEIMRAGGDSTDFSYESANEDFSLVPRQRSPTQLSKNQEGIGSFDSWNYVFENLDRTAYTKDVGDGENLLVKSLDLDSLNITNDSTTPSQTNMVDKRKSTYRETDSNNQQNTKQKQRLFEPTTKPDVSTTTMGSNINTNNPKPKAQIDNKQKIKPALKQSATIANAPTSSTSTTKQFTNSNKKISNLSKINDNKPKANTNDNNNSLETGGSSKQNKKSMSSTTQNSGKKSSEGSAWSCRFCTFINPDTTRICEICCRTKDNNLNASSSTKATQSINHSAPTCV